MTLLRDGAPVRTTRVNPLSALTGQVSTFEGLIQEAILQNTGVARLDWVRAEGLANFPGLSGLVAGAKGDMEELEQVEVDRTADVPGLGLALLQGLGQRQVGVAVVSDSRSTFDLELRAGDLQGLAGLAFNGAGATDGARGRGWGSFRHRGDSQRGHGNQGCNGAGEQGLLHGEILSGCDEQLVRKYLN